MEALGEGRSLDIATVMTYGPMMVGTSVVSMMMRFMDLMGNIWGRSKTTTDLSLV